jgi:exosortase family protein XrtF
LKALFVKYKAVIRFLALFFGVYLFLSLVYGFYLQNATSTQYYPEIITNTVTKQAAVLVEALGYKAEFSPHPEEASMRFAVDGSYVARIVEGCNAVSVMILFVAFVFAFWQGLKPTLFYALAGVVLIYVVNTIRVALFVISLKQYPQYRDFLHDIAFPGVIYGMVFLLWLYWIKKIPVQKVQHAKVD